MFFNLTDYLINDTGLINRYCIIKKLKPIKLITLVCRKGSCLYLEFKACVRYFFIKFLFFTK